MQVQLVLYISTLTWQVNKIGMLIEFLRTTNVVKECWCDIVSFYKAASTVSMLPHLRGKHIFDKVDNEETAMFQLLTLVLISVTFMVGCSKSKTATNPGAQGTSGGVATQDNASDDQLMKDYIKLRNDCAEAMEKKAGEQVIRELSEKSTAKLTQLQALPQDRQMKLQTKYKAEWDAMQKRVREAITGK